MLKQIPLQEDGEPSDAERRLERHFRAGLAFDLDLVPKKIAKPWQEAVVAGEFDPDRCAEDVLGRVAIDPADPRLVERSGRLLRDFCMSGLARGAAGARRRAKRAAQGGLAFLISQGLALGIFALILLAMLLLARLREISVDGWLDRLLFR